MMREHHAHIAAYGQSLALPDLADCASLAECLDRVRDAAGEVRAGGWVRFLGARVEAWPERRWPTITELDRAAAHRCCAIMSFDHHCAAANSHAMRAGGVRAGQAVPPKGVVCVDGQGEPTGLLLEHAAYKVWEAAPEPSRAEVREHVLAGLNALKSLGFDEVHDLHSQDWLGPVLADLERQDELPVGRVLLYPNVAKLGAMHATRARWESDRVRLAGGKLFVDGTLNSRTALMLTPYMEPLEGLPLGQAMATAAEIGEAIALTKSLGLQLAAHAIGDGAVRMVLDAWEQGLTNRGIEQSRGGTGTGFHSMTRSLDPLIHSLRIEHCELIDGADVARFAKLGVVCSVQPCHLLADIPVLTRQMGDRLDRVLPLRELIDSGCTPAGADGSGLLWFGSDVPIVRAEPGDSIRAAVDRRGEGMAQSEAIGWDQRITEEEAWAAFGRDSTYKEAPLHTELSR